MKKYYILKQLVSGAPVWITKLNPTDTVYEYDTEAEANDALPTVQSSYANNLCKVGHL